jgi:hypothetical protein
VASFTSLPQGQAPLMHNILLLALSQLGVRALVTLGPSLDPAESVAPPNVVLKASCRTRLCCRRQPRSSRNARSAP